MNNSLMKMSMDEAMDVFFKFNYAHDLASKIYDSSDEASSIFNIKNDEFTLRTPNNDRDIHTEDLKEILSYVDGFFKAKTVINDGKCDYYLVTLPIEDDFIFLHTHTAMYNIEIVQESTLYSFAKSLLVKKQDSNKPAFLRTNLSDNVSIIIVE